MSKHHILKCDLKPFAAVAAGEKTFDFRLDDRGYAVGDIVHLQEFDRRAGKLTGKTQTRLITYILRSSYGVPPNYAVLALNHPNPKSPFKMGDKVRSAIGSFEGPAIVWGVDSNPDIGAADIVCVMPISTEATASTRGMQYISEHYNFIRDFSEPSPAPVSAEAVEARMTEIYAALGDGPREDWMRPLEEEWAFCRGQLSILRRADAATGKEAPAADQAAPPEWTNEVVTGPSGLRLVMRHSSGLEILFPAWTR